VPIPDERMGEVGVAFIVPAPGKSVDLEALKALAADRLARFKVGEGLPDQVRVGPVAAPTRRIDRDLDDTHPDAAPVAIERRRDGGTVHGMCTHDTSERAHSRRAGVTSAGSAAMSVILPCSGSRRGTDATSEDAIAVRSWRPCELVRQAGTG